MSSNRKAAIITGGTVRTGKAFALHFAALGYDIALHARTESDTAYALCDTITNNFNVVCNLFTCDLSIHLDCVALMRNIAARYHSCNILINNASVFRSCDKRLSDAYYMRVNFLAPVILTDLFYRYFGCGNVINMIDYAVRTGRSVDAPYLMSKKYLASFTAVSARVLPLCCRVNAICPLFIVPFVGDNERFMFNDNDIIPRTVGVDQILQTTDYIIFRSDMRGELFFLDYRATE